MQPQKHRQCSTNILDNVRRCSAAQSARAGKLCHLTLLCSTCRSKEGGCTCKFELWQQLTCATAFSHHAAGCPSAPPPASCMASCSRASSGAARASASAAATACCSGTAAAVAVCCSNSVMRLLSTFCGATLSCRKSAACLSLDAGAGASKTRSSGCRPCLCRCWPDCASARDSFKTGQWCSPLPAVSAAAAFPALRSPEQPAAPVPATPWTAIYHAHL